MATDPMAVANMLDPSLYAQQLQATQTQQLADLLMKQGLSPIQSESVGGVAGRISPWQFAGKMASLLSGQSMQSQANQQLAQLMQRQSQSMAPRFGMGGSGETASPAQLAMALGVSRDPSAPDANGEMTNTGGKGPTGYMPLYPWKSAVTLFPRNVADGPVSV